MKKIAACMLFLSLLAPALLGGQDAARGSLVIMGGGIHSSMERIYRRFIELGGGTQNIRLAIIPAGSVEPAVSGRLNAEDFVKLGVPAEHIRVFPISILDDPTTKDVDEARWRGNGFNEELAREMLDFTAVYFVGGDQIRYNQALKRANGEDSPLLRSIRRVYAAGGVIGGSSAGAAMMCDPMICDGYSMKALLSGATYQPASCPEARGVSLANGLGFFTGGLVDQHFLKRGRIGRALIALYALRQFTLGIGIDEDTAAVCCGGTIEVLGSSGILVIDVAAAKAAGDFTWSTDSGFKARGIILHYLEEGDRFDLAARTPLPRYERKPIVAGKQENVDYPLETNLFAPDAFRNMLVDGMAENQKDATAGIAFTLDDEGRGSGSQWTLRKTERFAGLYASIGDVDTYSVTYVSLDIQPISLRVKKK
ncbi:MAG: cyanophycinase [Acidobacteria bacterium]|jgi:cyanophycinase|nr:cyanophycinase [Acidobacteriota bacterium]